MNAGSSVTRRWAVPKIEGAVIPVLSRGEGRPVLLTHGIPGDLRSLGPVAERLAPGFEAITPSLPALPGDARPTRRFGTEGQRDDLIDLIPILERGPVHLVAWSYSAHAAMAVAIDRPDLFRSLFLYDPGFPTFVEDTAAREAATADMTAAFGPVAAALACGDREAALRLAIDGAAGAPGYFDSQPEAIRTIHRDAARMIEAIFEQTDPVPIGPEDLGGILCPVAVACGAETRLRYRIVSDTAARLIPRASHVVVANAGHLLPEQEPARFAALVRAHLRDAEAGSARSGPASSEARAT